MVTKMKIRRGDTVRIIRGKDRGKKGKVISTLPKEGRLIVEGANVVHKHVRARRTGESGQRVEIPAPLRIDNVQLVCPECKKGTRVKIVREGDKRERVCKNCDAVITNA